MRTAVLFALLAAPALAAGPPAAPRTATLGSLERKVAATPLAVRVHSGRPLVTVVTEAGGVSTWNLETGRQVADESLLAADQSAGTAAVSPDGRWVAAVTPQSSVLFDAQTRQRVSLAGPQVRLIWPAFSGDSRLLVGLTDAADALHLVAWDLQDGRWNLRWRVPAKPGRLVSVSADGKRIARTVYLAQRRPGGPTPTQVQLIDAATGKTVREIDGLDDRHALGPFAADGRRFLTYGLAVGTHVWDAATGQPVRAWKPPVGGDDSLFSPDGRQVFVGTAKYGDGVHRLCDVETGQVVRSFGNGGEWGVKADVAADGRTFVAVGRDWVVRVWDVAAGTERFPVVGHAGQVTAVAWLPDGSVASGGTDGSVRVWGTDGTQTALLPAPPAGESVPAVSALAVGRRGRIAVGQAQSGVRLWDRANNRVATAAGRDLFPGDGSAWVTQIAVAADDACRVVGGATQSVVTLTADGKRVGRAAEMPTQFDKGERALVRDDMAVALEAGLGVAYYEGHETDELRVWDFNKGELRAKVPLAEDARPRIFGLAPNGRYVVANDARQRPPTAALRVHDLTNLSELGRLAFAGPLAFTPTCVVSPDSRLCAVRTSQQQARFVVFDVARFAPLATVAPPVRGHRLAFAADGRVAVAGYDSRVHVHDLRAAVDPAPPAFDPLACWADLVSPDGLKATRAVYRLAAHPADATKLFREKLLPVVKPKAEDVAAWVNDLDAPAFATRQAATKKLAAAADALEAELKKEVATNASPEVVQAVTTMLAATDKSRRRLEGEHLRAYRVVQTLEAIGPPAAELLKAYAGGAKGAFLTQEAEAAWNRTR